MLNLQLVFDWTRPLLEFFYPTGREGITIAQTTINILLPCSDVRFKPVANLF